MGKTIQIIEYAVRAPSNLDCTPTKALCRSLIWLLLLLLLFWWVGVCCLADGIPKIKLNKMCFDVSMFESEKVENDWLSGLARLKFILVDCFYWFLKSHVAILWKLLLDTEIDRLNQLRLEIWPIYLNSSVAQIFHKRISNDSIKWSYIFVKWRVRWKTAPYIPLFSNALSKYIHLLEMLELFRSLSSCEMAQTFASSVSMVLI